METFIKRFVGIFFISIMLFFAIKDLLDGKEVLALGIVLILLLAYLSALVRELIDLHIGKEEFDGEEENK
ncbi:hypothetical protein E3U55_08410 [Filobacillus milosensis]|uniref:Uncharacterized protein n=1 Tax=Filobacillus milosensis TaxID=94137 RepID=A0A4Y8IL04_9BACI|nr:hypothetical protein [Filobacillus milosensis]TFB21834.1 hypothetical protein E3U55_08410 [Filobacillus milosensis]